MEKFGKKLLIAVLSITLISVISATVKLTPVDARISGPGVTVEESQQAMTDAVANAHKNGMIENKNSILYAGPKEWNKTMYNNAGKSYPGNKSGNVGSPSVRETNPRPPSVTPTETPKSPSNRKTSDPCSRSSGWACTTPRVKTDEDGAEVTIEERRQKVLDQHNKDKNPNNDLESNDVCVIDPDVCDSDGDGKFDWEE